MKCECIQEYLKEALFLIERHIGKRTTLPVLSAVLLTAEKGRLKLTTTNLETGIEYWIPSKISEEGSAAVPAPILSSYVSLIKDEKVILSF